MSPSGPGPDVAAPDDAVVRDAAAVRALVATRARLVPG